MSRRWWLLWLAALALALVLGGILWQTRPYPPAPVVETPVLAVTVLPTLIPAPTLEPLATPTAVRRDMLPARSPAPSATMTVTSTVVPVVPTETPRPPMAPVQKGSAERG